MRYCMYVISCIPLQLGYILGRQGIHFAVQRQKQPVWNSEHSQLPHSVKYTSVHLGNWLHQRRRVTTTCNTNEFLKLSCNFGCLLNNFFTLISNNFETEKVISVSTGLGLNTESRDS